MAVRIWVAAVSVLAAGLTGCQSPDDVPDAAPESTAGPRAEMRTEDPEETGRPRGAGRPGGGEEGEPWSTGEGGMRIASGPLVSQGRISRPFTCEGPGISPPLMVGDVPEDAVALAVVMDDLDAGDGPALHWHVHGIDPDVRSIEADQRPPGGTGMPNAFGHDWYEPACPAGDETHRYRFTVYALGEQVDPPAEPDAAGVRAAYAAAALAWAEILAEYFLGADPDD